MPTSEDRPATADGVKAGSKQRNAQPVAELKQNPIKNKNNPVDMVVSSPMTIPRTLTNPKKQFPQKMSPQPVVNACPGVFSSPKPENIPMPMGLLQRFTAVAIPVAAA